MDKIIYLDNNATTKVDEKVLDENGKINPVKLNAQTLQACTILAKIHPKQ